MSVDGLKVQRSLSEIELTQVRALEQLCRDADGVDIKFNYGMIVSRPGTYDSDMCWFDGGVLVGYAPLDKFGTKGEITAAVHPNYRRRGIFTNLYRAAVQSAHESGCTELLLVNYRNSLSGSAAVNRLGLRHDSSEYCMSATLRDDAALPKSEDVQQTEARESDLELLAYMLSVNFGSRTWGSLDDLRKEIAKEGNTYYLARADGHTVGHIGVSISEGETYIRGVGIVPEYRGKGYGRQMLAQTLRLLIKTGASEFELDVATMNESALSIYKSCGFGVTNIYDYHAIPSS